MTLAEAIAHARRCAAYSAEGRVPNESAAVVLYSRIREMEAERDALKAAQAWQPIETAPKPVNWFDAGYLGNGHCSWMQAMNGRHYCCRLPHAHEGTHQRATENDL